MQVYDSNNKSAAFPALQRIQKNAITHRNTLSLSDGYALKNSIRGKSNKGNDNDDISVISSKSFDSLSFNDDSNFFHTSNDPSSHDIQGLRSLLRNALEEKVDLQKKYFKLSESIKNSNTNIHVHSDVTEKRYKNIIIKLKQYRLPFLMKSIYKQKYFKLMAHAFYKMSTICYKNETYYHIKYSLVHINNIFKSQIYHIILKSFHKWHEIIITNEIQRYNNGLMYYDMNLRKKQILFFTYLKIQYFNNKKFKKECNNLIHIKEKYIKDIYFRHWKQKNALKLKIIEKFKYIVINRHNVTYVMYNTIIKRCWYKWLQSIRQLERISKKVITQSHIYALSRIQKIFIMWSLKLKNKNIKKKYIIHFLFKRRYILLKHYINKWKIKMIKYHILYLKLKRICTHFNNYVLYKLRNAFKHWNLMKYKLATFQFQQIIRITNAKFDVINSNIKIKYFFHVFNLIFQTINKDKLKKSILKWKIFILYFNYKMKLKSKLLKSLYIKKLHSIYKHVLYTWKNVKIFKILTEDKSIILQDQKKSYVKVPNMVTLEEFIFKIF